jgi:hypothetical protein
MPSHFAISRIQSTAQELGGWDAVLRDFKDWAKRQGSRTGDRRRSYDNRICTWNEKTNTQPANKNVKVDAPTVINVHGTDAEAGKKVGADVHRNMVNAHERAAMQGG